MAIYAKMPFYKLCCPTSLSRELILVSCQQTNAASFRPWNDFAPHLALV